MNANYLYEYVDIFERVLSFAYVKKYSTDAVERFISYSSFFIGIESNQNDLGPTLDDKTVVGLIYSCDASNLELAPFYAQCLWAAEAYLRIQHNFGLTFDAIFL